MHPTQKHPGAGEDTADLAASFGTLSLARTVKPARPPAQPVKFGEWQEALLREKCRGRKGETSVAVTRLVKDMSKPREQSGFDNTRVHSDALGKLGICVPDSTAVPYGSEPNKTSPWHDHMTCGLALLTGLGVSVLATEVVVSATLAATTPIDVHGRLDAVGYSIADDAPVVIEVKSSGYLTEDGWYKDVMRRTYIQQVQLGALMVHIRTGVRPKRCLLLAGPSKNSKNPAHALFRVWIDYDPVLWLCDVNKHQELFTSFSGKEEAPPCAKTIDGLRLPPD